MCPQHFLADPYGALALPPRHAKRLQGCNQVETRQMLLSTP